VKRVFVDTSGFFAQIVRDDDNHEHAQELFTRAEQERWRLLMTNFVIFETHALLLHRVRLGREIALAFLDNLATDQYQLVRFRRVDEQRAIAIIRSHRDKRYSLCDRAQLRCNGTSWNRQRDLFRSRRSNLWQI
jgi:predicted nucleic acid-binding protein